MKPLKQDFKLNGFLENQKGIKSKNNEKITKTN
jgi:hypothetical protein